MPHGSGTLADVLPHRLDRPARLHRRHRSRCCPRRDYVADARSRTVLFLALRMGRPLFLEGEAGVGKTEIAKVLASVARTGR